MSEAHNKLARILRTQPDVLLNLEKKLNTITGKSGVMDKVIVEIDTLVNRTIEELGLLGQEVDAKTVYGALVSRLEHTDEHLYNFLDKPDLTKLSMLCGKLCETAILVNKPKPGFFIKKEKAVELLSKFPPQNLLDHFECKTVQELVEKQSFESVFSALRFAQDQKWMHEFFDRAFDNLTPDDFEERDVQIKVLEPEWLNVAEKFLEKKYHNVSHLKELGIIFVIPLKIDTAGETTRLFTLILHYLNEVPFYSRLFKRIAKEGDFVKKFKSLLRGDVSETPTPDDNSIRIVQRYLAKDDPEDFRLKEPHINPEAEHWFKAEGDMERVPMLIGTVSHAFSYWQGLDFVGDFFPSFAPSFAGGFGRQSKASEGEQEEFVSFDLIDLIMSLVKKGKIMYLYHLQEALWNKIFIEYLGRDKIEELVEDNIIGGFIKL